MLRVVFQQRVTEGSGLRGPGRRLNSAVGIDGLYVDC